MNDKGTTPPATRLHRLAGELAAALALWSTRDDTAGARQAANAAIDTIDSMLAELHAVRRRVTREAREDDAAAMKRADELLKKYRDGES